MTAVQHLTTDEAHAAVDAAAFTIQEGYEGPGTRIIHSFLGPFGADGSVEHAHTLIDQAKEIGWIDDLVGHDLAVLVDGKIHRFDVKRPS